MKSINKKRRKRHNQSHPEAAPYNQFGYESTGWANLVIHQATVEKKYKLRTALEENLRNMIKKYKTYDTNEVMSRICGSIEKNDPVLKGRDHNKSKSVKKEKTLNEQNLEAV